ncbi:Asp-tRNA(Asn)/Glu-tRNA(Gln) amidotransferase GatCAB subunit B [Candidatus Aerophobetes bacterium]|uniref:Aspartyl/glutamyl-tRNA(Asn/Gln) amidotransferase subunit B n=1 Tax=Aerophobetes bacterium TaxID=2030807 RepID=A0A2A4X0Q1_UNCAE|nr:MAG: Asp-tRNA(Asn)/Glu-tRNA(Gln) amidotransferase GatCAB subunit B [Candidatus Aerophobetes bacterium]
MSKGSDNNWEVIIGLEIHLQLNTKTKLFSSSPNQFGAEPNTHIDFVNTAQPGSLPRLNQAAVDKAIALGLALKSKIAPVSAFDRKSYFYPDCPRNFQITQFFHPILIGGRIDALVDGKEKTFFIDRAHLEDDAGIIRHFTDFAGVDFNRAGTPLIEIVSTPCMRSAKEAVAFAKAVKAIAEYLEISDCQLEEGSFRMDTNVSVRIKGEIEYRNKIEVKNVNSFNHMEIAIADQVKKQIAAYESRPDEDPKLVVKTATARFDLKTKSTPIMREKESASDYRYCPEPDLPPLYIAAEQIEAIAKDLPEFPHARQERYIQNLGLTPYFADLLVSHKPLSDYFEKALVFTSHAVELCKWISIEFVGRLNDADMQLHTSDIPHEHVAMLVNLLAEKKITGRIAKEMATIMCEHIGKSPLKILEENPHFKTLDDASAIDTIVTQVLDANPSSIEAFKSGKDRAFNYLVGQVMKESKGTASPDIVKQILTEKLKK